MQQERSSHPHQRRQDSVGERAATQARRGGHVWQQHDTPSSLSRQSTPTRALARKRMSTISTRRIRQRSTSAGGRNSTRQARIDINRNHSKSTTRPLMNRHPQSRWQTPRANSSVKAQRQRCPRWRRRLQLNVNDVLNNLILIFSLFDALWSDCCVRRFEARWRRACWNRHQQLAS
jgi:hypothetical protein